MQEMDLSRHIEVFNPNCVDEPIHLIGVGATGSFVAMELARMGVKEINIYDFDTVEIHNIPNQYFDNDDLDKSKVEALVDKLHKINPEMKINAHVSKVEQTSSEDKIGIDQMSGYVFLLVDSMAARKELFEAIKCNENIKHYWESRLGSKQGTVYYLPIEKDLDYSKYETIHFYSDEQAEVSACGTSITVLPIVMMTASLMIEQFIKIVMDDEDVDCKVPNYCIFDAMLQSYREFWFEEEQQDTTQNVNLVEEELDL